MKKTLTLLSLFLILSAFSLDAFAKPQRVPRSGRNKSAIKSATGNNKTADGEEVDRD